MIYLSIGEKEFVKQLQERFGCNYIDAVDVVIKHKQKLITHYQRIGYKEMAEQLKKELGE